MTWPSPVRIIGVGSPHGDDAAGWEVISRLRSSLGARPGIELRTLESGQGLLDILDGQGSLILIDALAGGATPGTIYELNWPDPRLENLRPGSTHDLKPLAALQLAETLGLVPSRLVIIGIEMETVGLGSGLSPAVAAAVPAVVHRIAEMIEKGGAWGQ